MAWTQQLSYIVKTKTSDKGLIFEYEKECTRCKCLICMFAAFLLPFFFLLGTFSLS